LDFIERLKTVYAWHADVHKHNGNIALFNPFERFPCVLRQLGFDPLFIERFFEDPSDAFIVINY